MRISNRLTWSLFLASSIGLVLLSIGFHQRGWGIFLERSSSGRHLPLGILVVLCAAVWVIAVIALLFLTSAFPARRQKLSAHLHRKMSDGSNDPRGPEGGHSPSVRFTSSMVNASTLSPTLMSLKFLMERPHS